MKFQIVLSNAGGTLDRVNFQTSDPGDVTALVAGAIDNEGWILSVGDTIHIREIEA